MHGRFPFLKNYQKDWVLKGLTTNFLKAAKDKLARKSTSRIVAEVSAAVNKM